MIGLGLVVPTRVQCGLGTSHTPLNCFASYLGSLAMFSSTFIVKLKVNFKFNFSHDSLIQMPQAKPRGHHDCLRLTLIKPWVKFLYRFTAEHGPVPWHITSSIFAFFNACPQLHQYHGPPSLRVLCQRYNYHYVVTLRGKSAFVQISTIVNCILFLIKCLHAYIHTLRSSL